MLEIITDHIDQAKKRLISQFRGKPKIEGILEGILGGFQDIETMFFAIFSNSIFNATGAQLDEYGEILDQPRGQYTDDEQYRVILFVKIARNISNGTYLELTSMFRILMNPERIEYIEHSPATFGMLAVNPDPIGDLDLIHEVIKAAKPAGVAFYLTEGDQPLFSFLEDPDPEGLGFDDLDNPGDGGTLANLF